MLEIIRRPRLSVLGVALVLVLAMACGALAEPPALTPLKTPVDVLMSLNWVPNAGHVGAFVAAEKGYWKDLGLNVRIDRGFGSPDTIRRLATGNAQFAVADANSLIVAKAKNPSLPVRAILNHYQRAPYTIYFVKGRKIKTPRDLATAVLGGVPNGADTQMYVPFLEAVGLPGKAAGFVALDPPLKVSALLQGRVDVLADFITTYYPTQAAAKKAGLDVEYWLMSDYGIDPYSLMLMTSDAELKEHPDVVDRFIRGWLQGWAYTSGHPEEAAKIFVKHNPTLVEAAELASLKISLPVIVPPSTAQTGIGAWDKDRWQYTVTGAKKWLHIEEAMPPVSSLYTDAHFVKIAPEKTWK
jgi:NitT/TauT family transport system substrate-binding protein